MSSLRVFLVDDLDLMTEAMSLRLRAEPDLSVVGTSRVADPDLDAALLRSRAEVVVLDVESPGVSAGDLIARVQHVRPLAAVVVLTGCTDPDRVVEAALAGADAWVHKQGPFADVLDAIRAVSLGDCRYPTDQLEAVTRALRANEVPAAPIRRSRGSRAGLADALLTAGLQA